jgi:hypothetical protein
MKCNRFVTGFLGVAFILLSVDARADKAEDMKIASLRGLDAVGVVVEPLGKDVEDDGLTSDQLRQDVELRLRKAGIRVLSEAEFKEKPQTPLLCVRADFRKGKEVLQGAYVEHVSLQLKEFVRLLRDPAIIALATTWESGSSTSAVGKEKLRQCRDVVADLTDEFSNDFLAANPKK